MIDAEPRRGPQPFEVLRFAAQARHITARRQGSGVITPEGSMEMADFNAPAPPPPLQIRSITKATPEQQIMFARDMVGICARVAEGRAEVSDKRKFEYWRTGARSEEAGDDIERLTETFFVDWLLRGKEGLGDKLLNKQPFTKALSVIEGGVEFLLDAAAAAEQVPSPFTMLQSDGLIATNVDWAPKVQKAYNIALQEAMEGLLDFLKPALEAGTGLSKRDFLATTFYEQRLTQILSRGRTDKPPSDPKGKLPVREDALRVGEGTRVRTGIDPSDARPRLDLVPPDNTDIEILTGRVKQVLAERGRDWQAYSASKPAGIILDALASNDLPTLLRDAFAMAEKFFDKHPDRFDREVFDGARRKLGEAEKIRKAEPVKAKDGELESFFGAMQIGAAEDYLGDRQVVTRGKKAGLDNATVSVGSAITLLSGGPIMSANVELYRRYTRLSGGPGGENAGHVGARGEVALGGAAALNFLKYTPASDYATFSVSGRFEVVLQFDEAHGIGMRGLRPLSPEGVASKVFKEENPESGVAKGDKYDKSVHQDVDSADLKDEFATITRVY